MSQSEGRAPESRALIVSHQDDGNAGALVAWLADGLATDRVHLRVVGLADVAAGEPLEPFMRLVGADDRLVVVHLLESVDDDPVSAGFVDSVMAADRTLCQRFPALRTVDTWIVVDLGRGWTDASRALAQRMLDVARETRINGVIAVTGSTEATVAGDDADRDGMVADAVWCLAVGRLAGYDSLSHEPRVWAFGSQSFTFDTGTFSELTAAAGVVEALDNGILRATSAAILDQSTQHGEDWVSRLGVGSEEERRAFTLTASGLIERLAVDESVIDGYVPADWPEAIHREYVRLSGAPLMRVRQAIEGNARVRLQGRLGEPRAGLIAAFDGALGTELRDPSGCLKAGRFLSGAAHELGNVRESVTKTPHDEPESFDVDAARARLDRCLARLPSPWSWVARTLALVTVVAMACSGMGLVQAIVLPALVGVASAIWGFVKRHRATVLRRKYSAAIKDRLHAIVIKYELAAQIDVIRQLQLHVGVFLDAEGEPTVLESAVEPQAGSRAADLYRLWTGLCAVRAEFLTDGDDFSRFVARPPSGRFFRSYPTTDSEAREVATATDRWATEAKGRARTAVEEGVANLTLDSTHEDIRAVCHDRAVQAVTAHLPSDRLGKLDQGTLLTAARGLAVDNAPRLDEHIRQLNGHLMIVRGQLPDSMHSVLGNVGAVRWETADDRRITRVWLAQQDFQTPEHPPLPLPPTGELPPVAPPPSGVRVTPEGI